MNLATEVLQLTEKTTPKFDSHGHDLNHRWTEPIQKTYPKLTTVWDFMQASLKFFDGRNVKSAPTVKVFHVDFIPFLGTNSLMVRAESIGGEKTSTRHAEVIQFYDVKFSDTPQDGYLEGMDAKTHDTFYFKPIQSKVNRMSAWCDCKDWLWRCSWSIDDRFKALAAKLANEIKNYQRKTPPPSEGGRPYANPGNIPTGCKHIIQVLQTLYANKVIR